MTQFSYDTADVVVHDPVAGNRSITRSALYSIGFRRIEVVGTLKDFEDIVRRHSPDLAICEARGRESDPCSAIQGLRQDVTAFNPFTLIIVTAWNADSSFVSRLVESGPDDLLLRPFSTNVLGHRIDTHARRRKDFVATADYIGPDRREGPDRTSDCELIAPPNPLRMKAVERLSPEDTSQKLRRELVTAKFRLNEEKLRRDAFHICVLWHLLQEIDPETDGYAASLNQIRTFTCSVLKRARHAGFDPAAEPCDAILRVLGPVENACLSKAEADALIDPALQLLKLFHADRTAAELLKKTEEAVSDMRVRRRLKSAALPVSQFDHLTPV